MKKLLSLLALAIFILAGCGTSDTAANDKPCETNEPKTIGMVTDVGGVNDKSFNQGTWEGIEQYCAESGQGAIVVQSNSEADYKANLESVSEQVEVVVAPGFYLSTPVYEVASANPDVDYILIDAVPMDSDFNEYELDNVHSYLFKEEEAGFLAGYAAAEASKTGHIAFVGGEPVPAVQKFGYGYIIGAQEANPDIIIDYQYSNTFTDQTMTKTITDTYIQKGADVIFTAAGGANMGVVNSAIDATLQDPENPVWVVGVDSDMYEDGFYGDGTQSVILTSAVKNVHGAAYEGVKAHFDGTFEGGVTVMGIDENGVGLPAENPNLDPAISDAAYQALEDYGTVPSDAESTQAAITTATVNGNI